MGNVLHFAPDGAAACGAPVFLCSDYTDDRRYVDCKRCKQTKAFIHYDPARFNVDVWTHEGDVIDAARSVTADEVDRFREMYAGNRAFTVVVEETGGCRRMIASPPHRTGA